MILLLHQQLTKAPKTLLAQCSIFNVLLRSKNITDSFTDMPPSIISLSTNNDNKSIIRRATNIKTKEATLKYSSSFFDTMKYTIYDAIHYHQPLPCTFTVSRSFIADHQKQFNKMYTILTSPKVTPSIYSTTLFSWPTRNRVFNIMSKPASSMFLQNATSSEHISTSSNPSFPRIR